MTKDSASSGSKHTTKPVFSFVMPVFNVEKYLDETVRSVIDQTIGFEQNIEIIFINDGSNDGSEHICLRYKKLYPKNIKYIKQDNKGVSAARNRGIKAVSGKYISFLDADDKLSPKTLEKVAGFFKKHHLGVDVVAIKMVFFGVRSGDHVLNWKFKKTRVIDLTQNPEYVQLSSSSTFIKADTVLKNSLYFDEQVDYAEDAKFISEILLKKMKLGILSEPVYYYRRREENNSAINASVQDKNWYLVTPIRVYEYLFRYSKEQYGEIPKYIMYLVMYDLQWRFTQEGQSVLDEKEERQYKATLLKLINQIDMEIILTQENIFTEHKVYLAKKKYDLNNDSAFEYKNKSYNINNYTIYDYSRKKQEFQIAVTELGKRNILLEGTLRGYIFAGVKFGFMVNGLFIEATKINSGAKPTSFLGEPLHEPNNYRVNLRLRAGSHASPVLKFEDGTTKIIGLVTGRHSKLPPFNGGGYFTTDNYIVRHATPNTLVVTKKTKLQKIKNEIRYSIFLLKSRELDVPKAAKTILIRAIVHVGNLFSKRRIWLVSDRPGLAGDNGEAFFKYAIQQNKRYARIYFVLSKKSPDYKRMKAIGKVLDPQSAKYKLLFLLSDKIISSAADDFVINPLRGNDIDWQRDLLKFRFVFLQHGVIYNDLSGWLNKFNKNIDTFITTSRREYDSILRGGYGYGRNNILLSGQARHDYLATDTAENTIVIMPTWRHQLAGSFNKQTFQREKNLNFTESEYYRNWQNLLLDKNFNNFLETNGINVEFYLHPALHSNLDDFKGTNRVRVMRPPFDYRSALSRGCLLVTDYSSVAFDFAYLRKQIMYFHFDFKKFYKEHMFSQGYFNYEKDGFGDTYANLQELVLGLREAHSRQYKLRNKYKKRIDNFFAWGDTNNSLRIYTGLIQKDFNFFLKRVTEKRKPIKINKNPINTYTRRLAYPTFLNFGDDLTQYFIKSFWATDFQWAPLAEAELIGVGSILERAVRRNSNNHLSVWGSGFIEAGSALKDGKNLHFAAVRGYLTYDRIKSHALNAKVAIGDPGLLASLIFHSSKKKTHKVGLITNYIDSDLEIVKKAAQDSDILVINPLQTPDKVALDITRCEIIFSSSLHGIIFADSFGIPNYWMPLSGNVMGGDYKFRDYFSSVNRDLIKINSSILNDSKEIELLKLSYRKITNLKKIQDDLIKSFPFR